MEGEESRVEVRHTDADELVFTLRIGPLGAFVTTPDGESWEFLRFQCECAPGGVPSIKVWGTQQQRQA